MYHLKLENKRLITCTKKYSYYFKNLLFGWQQEVIISSKNHRKSICFFLKCENDVKNDDNKKLTQKSIVFLSLTEWIFSLNRTIYTNYIFSDIYQIIPYFGKKYFKLEK